MSKALKALLVLGALSLAACGGQGSQVMPAPSPSPSPSCIADPAYPVSNGQPNCAFTAPQSLGK
jgi:predicted small lipoprotein YifL